MVGGPHICNRSPRYRAGIKCSMSACFCQAVSTAMYYSQHMHGPFMQCKLILHLIDAVASGIHKLIAAVDVVEVGLINGQLLRSNSMDHVMVS